METVNMHQAKTHFSKLVDGVANGKPFIIAKAGKPVAMVVAIPSSEPLERIGFLEGQIEVPEDFDSMGRGEIEEMFGLRG